jgi:hypothetical protein
MRLINAAAIALLLGVPPVFAEDEMPEDRRGVWVAQVVLATKLMFVTDCPCESNGESIEMTCEPFGGSAHVVLNDFWSKEGKAGDKGEVALDVDGVVTKQGVALEAYIDGTVPAFDVPIPAFDPSLGDEFGHLPWLKSIAWGRVLKLSYGGKTAVSPLKGSREAMRDMITYCRSK